jgi:hypothetical protein
MRGHKQQLRQNEQQTSKLLFIYLLFSGFLPKKKKKILMNVTNIIWVFLVFFPGYFFIVKSGEKKRWVGHKRMSPTGTPIDFFKIFSFGKVLFLLSLLLLLG